MIQDVHVRVANVNDVTLSNLLFNLLTTKKKEQNYGVLNIRTVVFTERGCDDDCKEIVYVRLCAMQLGVLLDV
jgi:hypothetical protein